MLVAGVDVGCGYGLTKVSAYGEVWSYGDMPVSVRIRLIGFGTFDKSYRLCRQGWGMEILCGSCEFCGAAKRINAFGLDGKAVVRLP